MTDLPDVNDVAQASQMLGLGASPAELHGGLCGWLAAGGDNVTSWPAKVLADAGLPAPTPDSPLDRLRLASVEQLEDRDFAFELLLVEAAAPVLQRTDALFEWCRAFLGGFGLAAGARPALSEEGDEALQDLAKLAQASSDEFDSGDEDEDALAEIEEFVRVAVLLLHGDCVMGPRHRQRLN
ncbi:MAG: YecA family protein [Stenotrophomonas sp.]